MFYDVGGHRGFGLCPQFSLCYATLYRQMPEIVHPLYVYVLMFNSSIEISVNFEPMTDIARWQCHVVVSVLSSHNKVNRHWARLVFGWVTVSWQINHLGM